MEHGRGRADAPRPGDHVNGTAARAAPQIPKDGGQSGGTVGLQAPTDAL